MSSEFWQCPKCKSESGGNWSQCEGKCPLRMSPHFDSDIAEELGFPVPYEKPLMDGSDPE